RPTGEEPAPRQGTGRLALFYPLGAMRQRNPTNRSVVQVEGVFLLRTSQRPLHESRDHREQGQSTRDRGAHLLTDGYTTKLWNGYIPSRWLAVPTGGRATTGGLARSRTEATTPLLCPCSSRCPRR